jgi:hypothetical protein
MHAADDNPIDTNGQRGGTADPLTTEHREQLAEAQQRRRKLKIASIVAAFNAWSFAILAVFSLLFVFFSLASLIVAALLAGLAFNEFRGRRQLLRLDPRGPKTLGINQVVCCILIVVYCGIMIAKTLLGPGVYESIIQESPELADMLEPLADFIQLVTLAVYGVVLFAGVTMQGLTACYYFAQQRAMNDYLQQTPAWILELDRAQGPPR